VDALRAIDSTAGPRSWRPCGPRRLRWQVQPALVATQSDMALHRSIGVEDSGYPEGEMAAGRDAMARPPDECSLG
jgi:hypothetical protein